MNRFDYFNPPHVVFGKVRIAQLKARGMVAIGEHKGVTPDVSRASARSQPVGQA